MPTIYANTADDGISTGNQANHLVARNFNGTGILEGASDQTTAYGIGYFVFTGRGAATYRIHRSFFYFDTSGITATPASATMSFFFTEVGNSDSANTDAAIFKSNAFGGDGSSALAATDFDNLDFNTHYASAISITNNQYNDFTLNSDALTDMTNDDVLIVALVQKTNDANDSDPGGATSFHSRARVRMANYPGTGSDPHIDYTLAGYSNDIIGVASSNIGEVNGISNAAIAEINGV